MTYIIEITYQKTENSTALYEERIDGFTMANDSRLGDIIQGSAKKTHS